MSKIVGVQLADRTLAVQFLATVIKFEDCWLRDNCRCPSCYYADKCQRVKHIMDIPDSLVVGVQYDSSQLLISWDDAHQSIFSAEFLAKFEYNKWTEGRRHKPIIWRGKDVMQSVQRIHVDKFLNSMGGARSVFQSVLDYGFAFIEGVKPSLDATEVVVKALGGVQHSIFGGMWSLTVKEHSEDLAFTNLPLSSHTDSTYFIESAGLQTFHCVKHDDGTGGETTLVDGLYGALRLKADHPEDFQFLSTFDVEAEFIDGRHHQTCSAPVIRLDSKTKDIKQIRLKVYDRAPMAFSSGEECRSYYRSIRHLMRYYDDPNNQVQFKLNPGVVLVMDNYRVLHGRTAFSGDRVLCGGAVTRSDWLDRARVLGLIQ